MITQYRCAACQVSSTVELLDPDLSREKADIANMLAQMRLCYATCPACGARNPEGVVEQQRDERNILIFTIALMVGLTIGSYFVPSIVLGWLGLFAALHIYFLVKQPSWALVFNLATVVAFGVAAWFVPRWAFVIVAIPTVQMLIKRHDPKERARPWERCAEQVRFFDTSQRRP